MSGGAVHPSPRRGELASRASSTAGAGAGGGVPAASRANLPRLNAPTPAAGQAGWNPPCATIAGQHFFDAGRAESVCGTVFYRGARVPQRDARHKGCPRCAQILAGRKTR